MGLNWIRERRRSSDKEVVQRKKVVNPDTGETPAGYNKMLRDCARIALAGASATLLLGWPQIALVASAIAAGLLQQGTTYSIKNWKWTAVWWCLLPACLTAWFLRSTAGMIDPDRGYSIYIIFVMVGRFTEFAAGSTVAIFLAFALAAPPDASPARLDDDQAPPPYNSPLLDGQQRPRARAAEGLRGRRDDRE